MKYLTKYQLWKNQNTLQGSLKEELLNLDEDQIKDAFSLDLTFGTSGLRGIMGPGTNRINVYTIRKAALGFGNYLLKTNQTNGVSIAYDNRFNSKEFAFESAKVLAAIGIKTFIFESLRPTPMLSFAVRHFQTSGGIIITASHNPKEYNGFKAYQKDGRSLNVFEANQVLDQMANIKNIFDIKTIDNELINIVDSDFDDIYLEKVKNITVNKTTKNIKIVYSPLHGTGSTVIPKLLSSFGYDVYPYEPQMNNDPGFSNTPSSNPEDDNTYDLLIDYATNINADIIMVTDPDADRLGIAVLHDNEYHLINGNKTASVELYYLLNHKKFENGFVFTTNVTTPLIKQITHKFGHNVIETLTGFKFLAEEAIKVKELGGNFIFACEESYGSLISDFVYDKDAVQACFLLAEITSYLKDNDLTIVDYINQMGLEFGHYEEKTKSILFPGIKGMETMNKIMNYYKNDPLILNNHYLYSIDNFFDLISIKDGSVNKLSGEKSPVLKYYYDGDINVILRPSGTEPKLKLYVSVKDSNANNASIMVDKLLEEVIEQIESVIENEK